MRGAFVEDFCGCPGELAWLAGGIKLKTYVSSSPLFYLCLCWPPKRKYNAASAIVNEIWQYRTGGSLTVFDKDHDTAEEGRSQVRQKQGSCSQAYGFATITMYSWWRFGEPRTVAKSTFFLKGGWKLVTLLAVPPCSLSSLTPSLVRPARFQ